MYNSDRMRNKPNFDHSHLIKLRPVRLFIQVLEFSHLEQGGDFHLFQDVQDFTENYLTKQ